MSLPTRERTLVTVIGFAGIIGMVAWIFMAAMAYCQENPKPAPKPVPKIDLGADWSGKPIDPPFESTSSTGQVTFQVNYDPGVTSYSLDLSYMEKAKYVDILFKIDGRDQSIRISSKTFTKIVRDGLAKLVIYPDSDIGISRQVGK